MRIKGKVAYAYTTTPDTQFDPAAWKVTVVVDKTERDRVMAEGNLKFTRCDGDFWEELGDYKVNIKRNTEGKGPRAGIANTPPQVALNGVPQGEIQMIGTGSLCEVEYRPYNWEFSGRKGTSGDFQGINILELVEVAPKPVEEEAEADTTPLKW